MAVNKLIDFLYKLSDYEHGSLLFVVFVCGC